MGLSDTPRADAAISVTPVMQTRIKPHHLVVVLGVAVALFTAASGIVAGVAGFHDDSPITREVFGNIPAPLKVAFYTVIPVLLVYGAVLFAHRVKNWQRGRPDNRRTTVHNAKHRMADLRAGVYMRTLLREPGAGVMHSLIYFSFLILLGVTTTLEVNHQLPDGLKFLHGDVYRAYSAVGGRRRGDVRGRGGVGHRAPLRPGTVAALPHPHQDPARARGHRRPSCWPSA